MRSVCAFLLASLVTPAAIAGNAAVIEWQPGIRLDWNDFKGPVPAGTEAERVAATAASLSWSFEYAVEWSGPECRFRIERVTSTALFHIDTSWVRPGHETPAVLAHEQGHFDLAEIYKRKLDSETATLIGTSYPCRSRSHRQATRSAEREAAALISAVFDQIWQAYEAEQATYDSETRHGIDAATQSAWTQRIEAALH